MPNRIYTLGQKIIRAPRFIANCIIRFGSYIVSKCERLINYIAHRNNEFPNNAVITRNVSRVNPAHDNLAIYPEDIQNQLAKKNLQLDSTDLNKAVNLISRRQYVSDNNIQYLNTIYLYITQLWANVAGQEEFSTHIDLANALKNKESDAINENYMSFINMMLNLYYINQNSQDIKKCADLILKIQSFSYNAENTKSLTETITTSQMSMLSIDQNARQQKLKIYLMLFFKLVEATLEHDIENKIIYNAAEDLQNTANKIYMFQCITDHANDLYMSYVNNTDTLSATDCYLIAYSYLATEQDITVNLKLPQISKTWKHAFQKTKKVLSKDVDLTRILSKLNLLQLGRRQEIDKYLYNELPIAPDTYKADDIECCISYNSPADEEQHNFVIYEDSIYTYDTFRTLYIQQGINPFDRNEIELNKLQRVIYTRGS